VTSSSFLLLLHVTQHAAPSYPFFFFLLVKGGTHWPSETKSDVKNGTRRRCKKSLSVYCEDLSPTRTSTLNQVIPFVLSLIFNM
jgi:hypothetical protein